PSHRTGSVASSAAARCRARSSSTKRAWSCSTAWTARDCWPWASASRASSAKCATTHGARCASSRAACDVSRYRPSPYGRWLQAIAVAAAYVTIAAAVFWFDLGDAGVAPLWAVVVVPPLYGVLSLLLLPRASLARRIGWVGGACLTHVTLGVAAAVAFWM